MSSLSSHPGVFITGADTGVGKTFVGAALARHLRNRGLSVGVMKPVETGVSMECQDESDAGRLQNAAQSRDSLQLVSPYRFPDPLAPLAAARRSGSRIEIDHIGEVCAVLSANHSIMVVEGVGGVLVPHGDRWDTRDLIQRLGLSVLVVGRVGLGGVNHALLTVDALRHRRIHILGLVLNEPIQSPTPEARLQAEATFALLRERSPVPVLGPIPHEPMRDRSWEDRLERVAGSSVISEVADLILKADR